MLLEKFSLLMKANENGELERQRSYFKNLSASDFVLANFYGMLGYEDESEDEFGDHFVKEGQKLDLPDALTDTLLRK